MKVIAGGENRSAHHAGQGVDLLTEDERRFIDEIIAHHTAHNARNGAHRDRYPKGILEIERFFDANHHEKRQSDGVEDEKGQVKPDKLAIEDENDNHTEECAPEVGRTEHPEGRHVEEQIAHRSATDGRDESDDEGPEPIETFGGSEADTADGKDNCADVFDRFAEGKRKRIHALLGLGLGMR